MADATGLVSDAVGVLVQDSLDSLTDDDLVEMMREWESTRRRMASFEHKLIREVENRGLPEKAGAKRTSKYLEQTLRIGHADACARVRAAELLGLRQEAGRIVEPWLSWTAAFQEMGLVSADSARVIAKIVNRIPGKVGDRLLGYLDPDGRLTDDSDRQRRRGLTIGKQGVDGMSTMTAELTPTLRALLDPIFASLARPGMCNAEDVESPWTTDGLDDEALAGLERAAQRDTRTSAQRNHDALVAFLRPEMGLSNPGQHRGLPVSTIITMSLAEVEAAAGVATTASGGTMPLDQALQLAQKSKPFLAIFDHAGRPLHLGRTKRLANSAQRLALIATERGCTRPGCSAPATLTQVHHVTEYAKGGATDIENLTLACDACHALIHDGPGGWKTIAMPKDSEHAGRTGWIAPHHIDPTGTPQVNERHHAGELMAASLARLRDRTRPPVKWWSRP
ncbi:HNH endonuclease signature motif containing protein [Nocardia tengchongensis]|uniref:HNH endonuclease signature motif containing protein n=1 Tax=Nocardia tengchongensis TaxID=2055889 RepID=UPI0036B7D3ED